MATQEAVMTTKEVANRLHELFQENKWMEAQQELFSEDAESIEPKDSPGLQSVKGIDAIRKKGEDFNNMVEEVHGGWVAEPIAWLVNTLPWLWAWIATYKGMGRQKMDEIALYEVKDGKIVKEQFFY